MTAVMRRWIGETVARELQLAVDWNRNKPLLEQRGEHFPGNADATRIKEEDSDILARGLLKPPREYLNDGSNFSINLPCGPGTVRTVQIVAFSEFKVPIQADVSDSESKIHAIFSQGATSKFATAKGKPFTQNTKGGVLEIRRARLIVTPHGPRSNKACLMIEEFFIRGSSGSDTFGRPDPLHVTKWGEQIKNSVNELFVVLHRPPAGNSSDQNQQSELPKTEPSDVAEKLLSFGDTNEVESSSLLNSQTPYLTQQPNADNLSLSHDVSIIGGVNLAVPQRAHKMKRKAEVLSTEGDELLENRKKSASLMAVLQRESKHSRGSGHEDDDALRNSGAPQLSRPFAQELESVSSQQRNVLAEVETTPALNPPIRASNTLETTLEPLNTTDIPDAIISRPHTSTDQNNIESRKLNTHDNSTLLDLPAHLQPVTYSVFHSGHFRFVQHLMASTLLSAEQQGILDEPSSWARPAPSYHFPSANVPVRLLERFNEIVESRLPEPRASANLDHLDCQITQGNGSPSGMISGHSRIKQEPSPDSSRSYDSDDASPYSEWVPSSPQVATLDTLPPDSSAMSPPSWRNPSKTPPLSRQKSRLRPDSTESSGRSVESDVEIEEAVPQAQRGERPRMKINATKRSPANAIPLSSSPSQPLANSTPQPMASKVSGKYGRGLFAKTSIRAPAPNPSLLDEPSYSDISRILQAPAVTISSESSATSSSSPSDNDNDELPPLPAEPQSRRQIKKRQRSTKVTRRSQPISPATGDPPSSDTAILPSTKRKNNATIIMEPEVQYLNNLIDSTMQRRESIEPGNHTPKIVNIEDLVGSIEDPAVTARRNRREGLAAIRRGVSHTQSDQVNLTGSKPMEFAHGQTFGEMESNEKCLEPPVDNLDNKNASIVESTSGQETGNLLQKYPGSVREAKMHPESSDGAVQVVRTPSQRHDTKGVISQERVRSSLNAHSFQVNDGVESSWTLRSKLPEPEDLGTSGLHAQAILPAAVVTFDDLHKRFLDAYPDYNGDLRHFKALCQRAQVSQHPFMWDDFVVRHKIDYADYTAKCNGEGADPISYENYYVDHVEDPKHSKRILTKGTLGAVSGNPKGASALSSTMVVPESSNQHQLVERSQHKLQPAPENPSVVHFRTTDTYRPRYSAQATAIDTSPERLNNESSMRNFNDHRSSGYNTDSPDNHVNRRMESRNDQYQAPPLSQELPGSSLPQWAREGVSSASSSAPSGPRTNHNTSPRFFPPAAPRGSHGRPRRSRGQSSQPYSSKPNPIATQPPFSEPETTTHTSKVTGRGMPAGGKDTPIAYVNTPPPRRATSNHTAAFEVAYSSPQDCTNGVFMSIEQDASQQNAWWKDDNTPFKEFARQYAGLKLLQAVAPIPSGGDRPRIDVFSWRLP